MPCTNCVALDAANFDTATIDGAEAYRQAVAGWLADHGDADLRGRLRSKRDADHFSARLELGLAGMFSDRGWELEHHPDMTGVSKRPEFLVATPNGPLLCEARMLHHEEVERQQSLRLDEIEREVTRLRGNYLVGIRAQTLLPPRPLGPSLRRFLAEHLRGMDLTTDCGKFTLHFEEPSCDPPLAVALGFHPAHTDGEQVQVILRSNALRSVAPYERVHDALVEKASRYGRAGLPPYLIVLWAERALTLDDCSIDIALHDTDLHMREGRGGFLTKVRDGERAYCHVSAVAFYHCRLTAAGPVQLLRIFHTPFADKPLDPALFAEYPQYVWRESSPGIVVSEWRGSHLGLGDWWTPRMTRTLRLDGAPIQDEAEGE